MELGKRGLRGLLISSSVVAMTASAEVSISTTPLFVTAAVEPNIITIIDDSGSMDAEILVPTNDGAVWWHTGDNAFVGRDISDATTAGVLNYNRAGGADGTWKKYVYLFPNGRNVPNRAYQDSSNDHYAVPPFVQYGYIRSAEFNGMYYDPQTLYVPWPEEGGLTFSDANPESVFSDPVLGGSTIDLTDALRSNNDNWLFRLYPGMVVPEDTVWRDGGSWRTATSDTVFTGTSSRGVEYYPATYYVLDESGQDYNVGQGDSAVSGSCDTPDPAHYVVFENAPSTLSGPDALAYDGRCLSRVEIRDDGRGFPSGRSYADEMQNFANWFQFYRKRHMATRAGISKTLTELTGLRLGALTNNRRSLQGMFSLSNQSERDDFFGFVYNRGGNRGGTPNREALDYVGGQFNSNNSVITESCQQNFALLFTDGFTSPNTGSGVGNSDGGRGEPFEDNHANTIADIADYYYHRTLRGGALAPGQVPTPNACFAAEPPLWADCRDDPHMVTYGITLGAQGAIFGVTHNTVRDAFDNPPQWLNPTSNRNPVQVDDLYHAAVNARGEMLNATNAARLEQVLGEALLDIVSRTKASATAATTSAAILQEDTLLYNVEFRSTDWSGNVEARKINALTGEVEGIAWSAEAALAARTTVSRKLFTWDGADGQAFTAAGLTDEQKAALAIDASGTNDDRAEDRINWFRGDTIAGFRSRNSVVGRRLIGDIVNSRPTYLQPVNRGYGLLPPAFAPETYASFLSTNANRPPVLFAGTNGGFMHVFNALTGKELFAYMPSELLDATGVGGSAPVVPLTDPDYEHRFFVDGTPAISDVRVDGTWRTVLFGTMGVGGRSIFAIDVTDPANLDESDILWEFTDADLGYGVTEPQIAPLANGKFGVIFGNGVNSDSNSAHLFVLDAADGSLIKKIDTGAGDSNNPNGLSSIQVTDWPDSGQVVSYVYGGDLQGNLWRFDLSTANTNRWDKDLVFVATGPEGNRQPITSAPRLALPPAASEEILVLFGTGSYFLDGDDSLVDPQVQTLYGIRDSLANNPYGRGDLLQQEILSQVVDSAFGDFRLLREVSRNTYDGSTPGGWYLDLIYAGNNVGERVVSRPTFPSGLVRERVRFTTMTPNDDPCSAGRVGFIFDLDLFTGGATVESVFDLNDDGLVNVGDLVRDKIISGVGGGQGEELTTIRARDGQREYFYSGEGERIGSGSPTALPVGRQSWQQLR